MSKQHAFYTRPEAIIASLKWAAKALQREQVQLKLSHTKSLAIVASLLGYNDWSLLSKDIRKASDTKLTELEDKIAAHQQLGRYVVHSFDEQAARDEMTEWVSGKFTPLIEFAYYDSESENGFAWPDVDLDSELQEQFGDRFPLALIQDVASDLEVDDGPWGLEDYGTE